MGPAVGRTLSFASCIVAAVVLAGVGEAFAATVDSLDASDPMTWLVKSVCTNSLNQLVVADPYYGCSSGIRKIQSGDPLPYHNIEQVGYQQRDAFPVTNPTDGSTSVIAAYDYSPFNIFNLYNGTDGYDIYTVKDGWASAPNTSDGGGYSQTFFGTGCSVGGGWVLFPTSFLTNLVPGATGSDATAAPPIADVYWEQSDQNYPGSCPAQYSTNTQTSWTYQTGFDFGGTNGNPVKTMKTVISYHGFQPGSGFLSNGHLEVFYFTREYGITRWEVWTPVQQNPTPTKECVVPASETYQGVTFVVQYCHDWSAYVQTSSSTPALPVWPVPNINLSRLANPHFAGTSGQRPPGWTPLGHLSATSAISKSCRDTGGIVTSLGCSNPYPRPGVAYVKIACSSNTTCTDFTNALYQNIPASGFPANGTYAFGVNARTEPVGTTSSSGTIGIEVEQLDAFGHVLSTASTTASVASDNGTSPSPGEAQSVYLSSAFVCKTTTITLAANARTIRFLVSPQTSRATFDVLNAWFAPYPVPTAPWAPGIDPCNPAAAKLSAAKLSAARQVDTP
jgi:hypothetical protein